MLAPLLKLLPWHNPPSMEEQMELNELIHDLDQAQERLDLAAQDVNACRRRYDSALTSLRSAADERARIGAELCQTKTGERIWKRWAKAHRWGRHYDDAVFNITG